MGLCVTITALVATIALASSHVRADIIHLTNGGTLEGDIVAEPNDKVRILLTHGSVVLDRSDIDRIEAAPTVLQRYAQQQSQTPDTARGELALGRWCEENGLNDKAAEHYRAAIRKDAGLAEAYEALGYVRVGDLWMLASTFVPGFQAAVDPAEQEQQIIVELMQEWGRRLRAIRHYYLDPATRRGFDERKFREGRERILAINDPLAIQPLVQVLYDGGYDIRKLLVEALGRFPNDEATLNLLVIAIGEPDDVIRQAAATELIPRKDPRVVDELRQALNSDNDDVVRRAATALGILQARQAVNDLIDHLTTQGTVAVAVPVPLYFGGLTTTFGRPTVVQLGGVRVKHRPVIAAIDPTAPLPGTGAYRVVKQNATIYRTEVQEALIAITGQNFGFDIEKWRRWAKQNPPAETTEPAGDEG